MTEPKARIVSSTQERLAIVAKLQEVCKLENGFATYAAGWDDQRVAEVAAPRLNEGHVSRLRQEFVGELPRRVTADEQAQRVAVLEATVNVLQRQVIELYRRLGETLPVGNGGAP